MAREWHEWHDRVSAGCLQPARPVIAGTAMAVPCWGGCVLFEVREDYKEKIRLMTEENRTCKFLDYDCQRGIWQFEVNRF